MVWRFVPDCFPSLFGTGRAAHSPVAVGGVRALAGQRVFHLGRADLCGAAPVAGAPVTPVVPIHCLSCSFVLSLSYVEFLIDRIGADASLDRGSTITLHPRCRQKRAGAGGTGGPGAVLPLGSRWRAPAGSRSHSSGTECTGVTNGLMHARVASEAGHCVAAHGGQRDEERERERDQYQCAMWLLKFPRFRLPLTDHAEEEEWVSGCRGLRNRQSTPASTPNGQKNHAHKGVAPGDAVDDQHHQSTADLPASSVCTVI